MRDGESRRWSSTPSGLPNTSIPMGTRLRLRVGQRARRVSTPACVGTIRFVGEVEGRAGSWVGIEWDDLGAGEMNGELSDGRLVFKVSERGKRSRTCASLCRESDLAASGAPLHHPFCLRPDAEAAFSDFCGRPMLRGATGREFASDRRPALKLLRLGGHKSSRRVFASTRPLHLRVPNFSFHHMGVQAAPPAEPAVHAALAPSTDTYRQTLLAAFKDISCCGAMCNVRPAPHFTPALTP